MEKYDDYLEWKDWRAESFGRYNRDQALYFRKILKKSGMAPGSCICEIGFGNGSLLGYLKDQGYDATGTEIQQRLLNRAKDLGFKVAASIDDLGLVRPQQMIVMLDVLEHIEQQNIIPLLRHLAEFLDENGKIFMTFPNADSPFGLRYQNGDVTHITAIGSVKLYYFARMSGYEVEFCGGELVPLLSGSPGKILKRLIGLPLRTLLTIVLRNLFQIRVTSSFFSENFTAILRKSSARPGLAETAGYADGQGAE